MDATRDSSHSARLFLRMRLLASPGPRAATRQTGVFPATPSLTYSSRASRLRLLHPNGWAAPSSSQAPYLGGERGGDQLPTLAAPLSASRTIRSVTIPLRA